jgi:molybdopterin-guanine dinucleotide biosynthesis protein
MYPCIITIAGTASNSGKTTLLCDLLRALTRDARWEAIKLSRGHYRSCGKDPHACCVSGLLGEEATVRSGREATYAAGKDTGRYWDAGASNVHWVIAADGQVEAGIREALGRVESPGVLIEGTSVLRYIQPDFALLALGPASQPPKPSARRALADGKIDALYVTEPGRLSESQRALAGDRPLYHPATLPQLIEALSQPENLRSSASSHQTRSVW